MFKQAWDIPCRDIAHDPQSVTGVEIQTPCYQGPDDDQDQLDGNRKSAFLLNESLDFELVNKKSGQTCHCDANGYEVGFADAFKDFDVALKHV